jgi:hypothetical protein
MSDNAKNWDELAESLRRSIASLLAAEVGKSESTCGGIPLSDEEVKRIVDSAFGKAEPSFELEANYSWVGSIETDVVEEQMLALNRSRGGDDADIDRRIEELRARALGRSLKVSKDADSREGGQKAQEMADEVTSLLGLTAPVDPFAVASEELPMLKVITDDFGDRFDGQLEFHRNERTFLMLVNSKYDAAHYSGKRHPRTRFSAAHELGHYFLDHHRACLLRGAMPHPSASDFRSKLSMEREADYFASALLMPQEAFLTRSKRLQTGMQAVLSLAAHFQTSLTSTAIRYATLNAGPVVIIKWNPDGFGWKWLSNDAYKAGIRKTEESRDKVPPDSSTGKVLSGQTPGSEGYFRAGSTAAAWFPFITHGAHRNDILIEEAISLGEHGALTILHPQSGSYTDPLTG